MADDAYVTVLDEVQDGQGDAPVAKAHQLAGCERVEGVGGVQALQSEVDSREEAAGVDSYCVGAAQAASTKERTTAGTSNRFIGVSTGGFQAV